MWPLLVCQLVFGAIIAFGPTINQANRIAGLASVVLSIVLSLAAARTSTSRELKLGTLALVTTALAVFALQFSDGAAVRNPAAGMGLRFMATNPESRLISPHVLGLAVGAPAVLMTSLAFHRGQRFGFRVLWLLAAASDLVILILSDSRAAAIAAGSGVVVLTVSFVVVRRGIVMLICGLAIVTAGLATLLLLGNEVTLRQRGDLWRLALTAVVDHPVFGLGYGGLSALYRAEVAAPVTNAHNMLIQTMADFGAVGLITLMMTVVWSVRAAIVDIRVSPTLFRGFAASIAFVSVAGMAESVIDMTQRFPASDVTIVVPLLFVVLAMPLVPTSAGLAPSRQV